MGSGASKYSSNALKTPSEKAILAIGELLHDAEMMFNKIGTSEEVATNRAFAFRKFDEAKQLLNEVDPEERDVYTTMIFAREGRLHFLSGDNEKATASYTVVTQRAEIRIALKCRGLYSLLQRYTECIVDQVKIWELQADSLTDEEQRRKKITMCEMALLRCIEMVEEGHNRRSDILVLPLTRLSFLYEKMALYKKAELMLRRCQGIIIVQFGYDHADLRKIEAKLAFLERQGETYRAVVKIQSVIRMALERLKVSKMLKKPLRRHELAPPAIRNERDKGEYLTKLSNLLEPGTALGHQVVGEADT